MQSMNIDNLKTNLPYFTKLVPKQAKNVVVIPRLHLTQNIKAMIPGLLEPML